MERTEVLDMLSGLKLYGMRSAYDETLATALKRKHEPQRFVGDLLKDEISEKQARSIKYQLTVAKLPLAKDVEDFAFKDTGGISRVRCGADEQGDCRLGIVISDCRSLVLERDQHLADAGNRGETPLHNVRAGRTGHVFNRKRHRLFGGKGRGIVFGPVRERKPHGHDGRVVTRRSGRRDAGFQRGAMSPTL